MAESSDYKTWMSHWLHKKVTTPRGETGTVTGYTEELEQIMYQVRMDGEEGAKLVFKAFPKEDLKKVREKKE